MSTKKYYAVKVGKTTGVLDTWEECKNATHGYPGAVYKSFQTKEEAKAFLAASDSEKADYSDDEVPERGYAFVDGSIDPGTGIYGAGGFLIDDNGQEHLILYYGDEPGLKEMRNVAGEILGATKAIELAVSLGMKNLILYYDYQGIESWATGMWKCNKPGTKAYFAYCQSVKDKISIHFRKVKGHTGVDGNEKADQLAKDAAQKHGCEVTNFIHREEAEEV